MGGLCLLVELHREWSAFNRATSSSCYSKNSSNGCFLNLDFYITGTPVIQAMTKWMPAFNMLKVHKTWLKLFGVHNWENYHKPFYRHLHFSCVRASKTCLEPSLNSDKTIQSQNSHIHFLFHFLGVTLTLLVLLIHQSSIPKASKDGTPLYQVWRDIQDLWRTGGTPELPPRQETVFLL